MVRAVEQGSVSVAAAAEYYRSTAAPLPSKSNGQASPDAIVRDKAASRVKVGAKLFFEKPTRGMVLFV